MRGIENLARTALLELFVLYAYRAIQQHMQEFRDAITEIIGDENFTTVSSNLERLSREEIEDLHQIIIMMEKRLIETPSFLTGAAFISKTIDGAFLETLRNDVRQHLFDVFVRDAEADKDDELRDFFMQMSKDEKAHEAVLEQISKAVSDGKIGEAFMKIDDLREFLRLAFAATFCGASDSAPIRYYTERFDGKNGLDKLRSLLTGPPGLYWSYCG